ncbi:MAG: TIGR00304 family membrane protein [Methanocella sp.]
MADYSALYAVGIALVLIGVALIVAVIIRTSTRRSTGEGSVRGAGVIMIGPIPIIFGTDKKSVKAVLALALALSIGVLIIYLIYYGLLR